MTRARLSNRRSAETFSFEVEGTATIGRFTNGRIADAAARDSAVVASIAFQFGVPVHAIRRVLLRDACGTAWHRTRPTDGE